MTKAKIVFFWYKNDGTLKLESVFSKILPEKPVFIHVDYPNLEH